MEMKMRKSLNIIILATFVIFAGCTDNPIKCVKTGLMEFNKTTTVGEALDSWSSCGEKEWKSYKSPNGVTVVEFTCVHKGAKEYGQNLKQIVSTMQYSPMNYLGAGSGYSKIILDIDSTALDLKSFRQNFRFTINKSGTFQRTFQLDQVEGTLEYSDGTKLTCNTDPDSEPIDVLMVAYETKRNWAYDLDTPLQILGFPKSKSEWTKESKADWAASLIAGGKFEAKKLDLQQLVTNHPFDSPIKYVQTGVMKFNQTTTVGEALDSWSSCGEKEWKSYKSPNGATVVEFTCVHKGVKEYGQNLKQIVSTTQYDPLSILAGTGTGGSSKLLLEIDSTALDLKSFRQNFRFTINRSGTFQLDQVEGTLEYSDGTKLTCNTDPDSEPIDALMVAYETKWNWAYDLTAPTQILGFTKYTHNYKSEWTKENVADLAATMVAGGKFEAKKLDIKQVILEHTINQSKRDEIEKQSQFFLNEAVKYYKGEGVKQDYAKAAELFQKACDGNGFQGCINLGNSYSKGEGVKQDYAKAVELYQKACDGKFAVGCSYLGEAYFKGEGVKQDYAKAVELYQKACDGKFAESCKELGNIYLEGKGVKQDNQRALEFLKKSCDLKDQDGCDSYSKTKAMFEKTPTSVPAPVPPPSPTPSKPIAESSPVQATLPSPKPNPEPLPSTMPSSLSTSIAPQNNNTAFAPSFDCKKATSGQDRMVCEDRELSSLDVELNILYSKARENSSDKNILKAEQLDWFKYSRNSCSDASCLKNSYKKRIAQLSNK